MVDPRVHVDGVTFGDRYRDTATGFVGVAVGVWAKLGNTAQVSLARIGQDGKPFEAWFDAPRLETVEDHTEGAHR